VLYKNDIFLQSLNGVSESLFLPLYIRGLKIQRSDAVINDERTLELVQKLNLDASQFTRAQVSDEVQLSTSCVTASLTELHSNILTSIRIRSGYISAAGWTRDSNA
jgi:hypothetical protein